VSLRVPVTWIVISAMMLTTCGNGEDSALVEISNTRQCRANMNTLATDQAMYHLMRGDWAASIEDLDREANRTVPLICPDCGEEYVLTCGDGCYTISCPGGVHGSVTNGHPSWSEGSPHY
jgi:hypothetical protein